MEKNIKKERSIDSVGRLVIPINIREKLNISENDRLSITADAANGRIIIEKAEVCMRCGSAENLVKIKSGFYICRGCLAELDAKE